VLDRELSERNVDVVIAQRLELPLDRMQVGIVTLKNRTISPVVRLFMDTVHEAAKPLAKSKR